MTKTTTAPAVCFIFVVLVQTTSPADDLPRFLIGMNVGSLNYWSEGPIFDDVMTTVSDWITYWDPDTMWNTRQADQLEVDESGYPVEIPQTIDGRKTWVRFMLNNSYKGTFRFEYEGVGILGWRNVPHTVKDGHHYIALDGKGGHRFVQITSSAHGNHLRDTRIFPIPLLTATISTIPSTYSTNNS